jgi:hypothetical protein
MPLVFSYQLLCCFWTFVVFHLYHFISYKFFVLNHIVFFCVKPFCIDFLILLQESLING